MDRIDEPIIIINGVELTKAQAMTIRIAVDTLMIDLTRNGLGNDEVGEAICRGYLRAIDGIKLAMHKR